MIATTNEPKFYLQFVNSHSFSVKLKVKKQSIMPQGSTELTETLLQKSSHLLSTLQTWGTLPQSLPISAP